MSHEDERIPREPSAPVQEQEAAARIPTDPAQTPSGAAAQEPRRARKPLDASESLSRDLLALLRERHPEMLGDPELARALATDARRARLLGWLVRVPASEVERLQAEIARRAGQNDLLRRELDRARRLAEVGMLAAGVAHDLNNMLQVAGGCAALARDAVPAGSPEHELLVDAVSAAQRATELVRDLVGWATAEQGRPQRIDLSVTVAQTLTLVESAVPSNVLLERRLASGLAPILADVGAVRRVVMNLVVNACQAIGDAPGRIRVETGADPTPDPMGTATTLAGNPKGDVWLEVEDDGPGMDQNTRVRAFEPFFTTRSGGSGLGLSLVRRFVAQFGGHIELSSAPGRGARFRVTLPATT